MQLVHEFTFHAVRGESFPIGPMPLGSRTAASVVGGWVHGERINGTVVGPGADWAIIGADGYAQVDVRCQIRTDDGAHLYLSYAGTMEFTEHITTALRGTGETAYGDNAWLVHLRLESGDERYRWVNRAMFVGEGRVTADGVEYDVCRITSTS